LGNLLDVRNHFSPQELIAQDRIVNGNVYWKPLTQHLPGPWCGEDARGLVLLPWVELQPGERARDGSMPGGVGPVGAGQHTVCFAESCWDSGNSPSKKGRGLFHPSELPQDIRGGRSRS